MPLLLPPPLTAYLSASRTAAWRASIAYCVPPMPATLLQNRFRPDTPRRANRQFSRASLALPPTSSTAAKPPASHDTAVAVHRHV